MSNARIVMKDERPIGRLVLAGANLWRAFDDRDRPLGIWSNEQDAVRACYRHARPTHCEQD